ncbi:NADH-quinone oxidoreductase subunit M [Aeoliella sp. ICT_H6.2]|uniref:NADH-quinone oxidoreductase subunit M n=1 Tax=Aeoliella straminimaris TaxID=2954799 RepID=A0A9X2JGB4_9BACT|nr:NADH-quinone oxidoreductase subunit M [Aeoliella straminimaris]MCO6044202.1 NADH-quinone oxidoreductase subunit M [Aeoliella straminimaris]
MNLDSPAVYLSLLTFLPAVAAVAIACFAPKDNAELIKKATLAVTVVTFVLSIGMLFGWPGIEFKAGQAEMQHLFSVDWIPTFRIDYLMGIDGISLPLVVLTTFITMLGMGASWPIDKHVKAYCVLLLLLETGMIGVFLALDFFLFYVFWEVMLLPMYFLIGIWGGPRREYAAIKFFLFTLFGSVLMLVAILMLYFSSDLRPLGADKLAELKVPAERIEQILDADTPQHTFNILALQQLGQSTEQFKTELWGWTYERWAFLLLFIGFIIKVPSVPLHTWLPDAHVEAPTPISMILAGVLLKMGGYGIIRICYPICPEAGYDLAWLVCSLGVVSMVYGAFAALAQNDFKRLVAYSSVSHMGYVVLGLGVWSAMSPTYNADYWKMGMNGAMFQMIAHGISSAGMFFMVGVLYERVHHRQIDQFGGIFARMPVYSGLAVGIFFAGLGLPGLCGFIGEFFVVLSTWKYCIPLAVVAAAVVILTAAYILWTLQRVYLGTTYLGPHEEALTPITPREMWIAAPLLALAILFGVYPRAILDYMEPSVSLTADRLASKTSDFDGEQQPEAKVAQALSPQVETTDIPKL